MAEGLKETRRDYSHAAFDRGDFDQALFLLDATDPDQADLVTSIQGAATERASRTDRIRRVRRFGKSRANGSPPWSLDQPAATRQTVNDCPR